MPRTTRRTGNDDTDEITQEGGQALAFPKKRSAKVEKAAINVRICEITHKRSGSALKDAREQLKQAMATLEENDHDYNVDGVEAHVIEREEVKVTVPGNKLPPEFREEEEAKASG